MPKTHSPYPVELKQRLVELVRAGLTPEELAQKFEPTAQTMRGGQAYGTLSIPGLCPNPGPSGGSFR